MPLTPEQAAALGLPAQPATLSADQAAALGLPAIPGAAQPPAPQIGKTESLIRGAAQGGSLGFGDEAAAGLYAALPGAMEWADKHIMGNPYPDAPYGKGYAAMRDYLRQKNAAAQDANPKTYIAGEVAGALAAPVKVGAARGLVPAIKTGAKIGTVAGVGASTADSLPGMVADALGGAAWGAAGGAGGELASRAVGAVARTLLRRFAPGAAPRAAAEGASDAAALADAQSSAAAGAQGGSAGAENASTIVIRPPKRGLLGKALREPEPIPEAEYLIKQGVPLTKGLYDPASGYGQVEIASTSQAGSGPLIRAQRDKALESALDLGFRTAQPPGAKVTLSGDINEKYSALKKAWDQAYNGIRSKNELVMPASLEADVGIPFKGTPESPGVFDRIINDTLDPTAAVWDDASRAQAKRFLDNQLTRLHAGAKDEAGRVPIGDMLKMLSDVRTASRSALAGQKYDLHQILSRAEDAIEQAVETQASPETTSALRALNAKYRDFKIIEDAVVRAGDSASGITPSRLSASVKKADPSRSRYASGGGGDMRQLSKAISTVFDESASPPTGARMLTAAPDWLQRYAVGPTIYVRNRAAINAMGGGAGAGASSGASAGAAGSTRGMVSAMGPMSPNLPFLPAGKMSPQVAAMLAALQTRSPLALPPAAADQDSAK